MAGLGSARDESVRANRIPQYQCVRCGDGRWRDGGGTSLSLHLAAAHGVIDHFPAIAVVDERDRRLSFDGSRLSVEDERDLAGLIRSVIPMETRDRATEQRR